VRAETRARIFVVIESGSEGHRKMRHILIIPSVFYKFPRRSIVTMIDKEKHPRKSFYEVDALFDTFQSIVDACGIAARLARMRST